MNTKKFIDVKGLIKSKSPRLAKWIPWFVIGYLRRILHEKEINKFIDENGHLYDDDFCQAVVDYFDIKTEIIGIENIPKTGPIIIAMNHPLGGMDAVAFIAALKEHRKDLRFIVNDLLMNLENMKNLFVGVNKHGKNAPSVRQQIKKVFESDHMVCIFPAGLVSRKIKGEISDLVWKKTFVQYARELNHKVVPIHIDGKLSNFFYRLSKFRRFLGIKANIEMLYLADEMFKQKGKKIRFNIEKPIDVNVSCSDLTDIQASEWFRKHVHSINPRR